jgi:hypothetical protein
MATSHVISSIARTNHDSHEPDDISDLLLEIVFENPNPR